MKKFIIGFVVLTAAACSTDLTLSPEEQLNKDVAEIDKYIADNNIQNVVIDPSGLRLVVTTTGTGPSPTVANILTVKYTGKFLKDGSIFDQATNPTNFNNTPLSSLIPGWQIGFSYLQKGSKATLYIPSGLAYGTAGAPPKIPGNSNLYFDVELVSFR